MSEVVAVMNQEYASARMAITTADSKRKVPVLNEKGIGDYSGYHQGSGQITVQELLNVDFPKYGLILIDEIESSLHPRAQRRLIRDLAEQARLQECQIVIGEESFLDKRLDELRRQVRNLAEPVNRLVDAFAACSRLLDQPQLASSTQHVAGDVRVRWQQHVDINDVLDQRRRAVPARDGEAACANVIDDV